MALSLWATLLAYVRRQLALPSPDQGGTLDPDS
jgi:hypothetical protein